MREMQFHITENWKNTRQSLEEFLEAQQVRKTWVQSSKA